MSAGLIASLFATAVAPSVLAAITVGSAGNVPVGGTSAANVSFTFTEQAANSLSNNPGSFTVTILDSASNPTVSFVGTPSTAGSTGSLGASASIAGNKLTVSIAGSDTANIESIFISGLKISASGTAALGAIKASITVPTTGQFTTPATVATAFSAGGTATGTLSIGYGAGATSIIVNNTSPGCLFSSAGTLSFATSPESVALTTASAANSPAAGQQTLTIGATANVHNAGEVVSESNGCAPTTSLASPGTVVAALAYSSSNNLTVYPGENNQFANDLVVTEPSPGFLAAGSTFTFTIQTAGVVFSTAPTVIDNNGPMTLSAPVISVDRKSATVTVNTASTGFGATITLQNILYDVAASVAPGTFISVGLATSGALAVLPPSVTNAVVFRGIAASATSPLVYIGENNQTAGIITFTESAAGFFTDGVGTGTNTFWVCPTGVTFAFTLAPYAQVVGGTTGGNLILRDGAAASTTNIVQGVAVGGGCYGWTVWTASTTPSTIRIGAGPSVTSGSLINVTSDQAPGGVAVGLWLGSSNFLNPTLAATVQFATAAYRNQVAVTALSQPAIAPGTTSALAGSISIAETGLGQLKATEVICVEILPRSAAQLIQDTFLEASDIASVPVVTATGTGLVIGPVNVFTPCAPVGVTPSKYSSSFSFTVLQQSTAGDGKLVISNIHYTTTADAHLGTVLVRVSGLDVHMGGTTQDFLSTVSNATIGSAAPISALSALGIPPNQGPWSTATKLPARGQYVTWQFNGGSSRAGHLYQIWFAMKNSAGGWGPFTLLTSRLANASGVANFWWKTSTAAWVSVRAYDASTGTWSWSPQARWR
ncbi:MAG: beta strand repeat-containing protein [Candidatus Limnocylindrales bacterium]